MTRQDGGTGEGWPPIGRSYKWWPKVAVARALGILGLVVLLGGCSGPFGTAMAGLFGAGAMYGGQSFLERGREDVEAKREWRVKKREYVIAFANGMEFEAETHKRAGRFAEWKTVMADLLKFWDTQHPETLLMELKRRTEVVPEPQMVAPANQ
ncbi:hypothetical protein LCGC14_1723000 [marine sediment metagenome]|uniref:Uncharacterized protein n=1 Tax=marine sediment metagenome TaxID=412755 RepID=A0A0F9HBP1_9ZZZZ